MKTKKEFDTCDNQVTVTVQYYVILSRKKHEPTPKYGSQHCYEEYTIIAGVSKDALN